MYKIFVEEFESSSDILSAWSTLQNQIIPFIGQTDEIVSLESYCLFLRKYTGENFTLITTFQVSFRLKDDGTFSTIRNFNSRLCGCVNCYSYCAARKIFSGQNFAMVNVTRIENVRFPDGNNTQVEAVSGLKIDQLPDGYTTTKEVFDFAYCKCLGCSAGASDFKISEIPITYQGTENQIGALSSLQNQIPKTYIDALSLKYSDFVKAAALFRRFVLNYGTSAQNQVNAFSWMESNIVISLLQSVVQFQKPNYCRLIDNCQNYASYIDTLNRYNSDQERAWVYLQNNITNQTINSFANRYYGTSRFYTKSNFSLLTAIRSYSGSTNQISALNWLEEALPFEVLYEYSSRYAAFSAFKDRYNDICRCFVDGTEQVPESTSFIESAQNYRKKIAQNNAYSWLSGIMNPKYLKEFALRFRTAFYSTLAGSRKCNYCNSADNWYEGGSSVCLFCPSGKSKDENTQECVTCPIGKYGTSALDWASSSFASRCEDCPPGRFTNQDGLLSCSACSRGKYNNSYGSSICSDCISENSWNSGGASCEYCSPGKVASLANPLQCSPCGPGTFASAGSSSCVQCLPGTFTRNSASESCQSCPDGRYAPSSGSSSCDLCDSENNWNKGGTKCEYCPAGKFTGSTPTSCSLCSPGRFSRPGATECLDCAPGKYSSVSGAGECSPCGNCYFAKNFGSTTCQLCISQNLTYSTNGVDCIFCSSGKVLNNVTQECDYCPQGYYLSAGETACLSCPSGRFKIDVRTTSCDFFVPEHAFPLSLDISSTVPPQCDSWNCTHHCDTAPHSEVLNLGKGLIFDHLNFACQKAAQELSDILRENATSFKIFKDIYDWDYPLQSMIGSRIKAVPCYSSNSSLFHDRFYCAIQKTSLPETFPSDQLCPSKFSTKLPRSVVACTGEIGCTKSEQCPDDKLCCGQNGSTEKGLCSKECLSIDGACRMNSDCESKFCSNLNGQLGGIGICRNFAAEIVLK
jgi:hypothetical protein